MFKLFINYVYIIVIPAYVYIALVAKKCLCIMLQITILWNHPLKILQQEIGKTFVDFMSELGYQCGYTG